MRAIERPGGHRSRRYVFREFDSLSEVQLIARGSDWQKVLDRPADPERGIPLHVKWELLPGLRISYKEDEGIESSYVMVTSTLGEKSVDAGSAVFEVHPKVVTFDQLISDADSAVDSQDKGIAVVRLGLGAPLEVDDRFVERINRSVQSSDEHVREGALWAINYTEWPIFRRTLREISMKDSDPFLREFAEGTLTAFDRLGLEGQ